MPTMKRRPWGWTPDPLWEALAWLIPAAVAVWTVLMILFWGEE